MRLEETEVEDQQLTAEQVADVIASIRCHANAEDKHTPAEYDHICGEEILRCMGHAPSVQLLARRVMFYRHCRDSDDDAG